MLTVRVTQNAKSHKIIEFVLRYISEHKDVDEDEACGVITLVGVGRCTSKCISVAEMIKEKCPWPLHQLTEIGSVTIDPKKEQSAIETEEEEAVQEHKNEEDESESNVVNATTKTFSELRIQLTTRDGLLNEKHPGYQTNSHINPIQIPKFNSKLSSNRKNIRKKKRIEDITIENYN
jgi:hypothetical protein